MMCTFRMTIGTNHFAFCEFRKNLVPRQMSCPSQVHLLHCAWKVIELHHVIRILNSTINTWYTLGLDYEFSLFGLGLLIALYVLIFIGGVVLTSGRSRTRIERVFVSHLCLLADL